jgi:hypothetical protein
MISYIYIFQTTRQHNAYYPDQWSSACGTSILEGTRELLTSIKTKHRNRLNFEPDLILALTKIRPRIEVLACQKQAQ